MLDKAMKLKDELVEHRRFLHAHAETGFDLHQTADYVCRQLEDMGYLPRRVGRCGIVVDHNRREGPTILLRADMDALPIREEANVEFRSQTENMHACGHDLHTAMLLGAAKLLVNEDLPGNVRFLFQPAEELLEGAKDMIDAGVLEGVDAAMMIHVGLAPLPTGMAIISSPGISAPAADYFNIRIQGKSCHGSAPQDGIDPIPAAAQILLAIQNIQTRELGLNDRAVLTIGSIHGGTAANVIADTVEMRGSLRTADEAVRQKLRTRMAEIVTSMCAVFKCKGEISFDSGCPCLLNDGVMSELATRCLKETLGEDLAKTTLELNPAGSPTAGGSEDFAYISQQVPSVMVALCAGNSEHTLHHPKVVFDEEALPFGAAAYASVAVEYLNNFVR